MMNKGLMMKNIKCFLTVFFISFMLPFTSCEVGLGEAVDTEAPVVNMTEPSNGDFITACPVIKGSASDNYGVTKLVVKIEETQQQFVCDGKKWVNVSNGGAVEYSDATISGTPMNFNWTLTVNINGAISGKEYTISAQVYDEYGNESKSSKQESIVKADIKEPNVSISLPEKLQKDYATALSLHNGYQLRDVTVLASIYNETVKIAGSQKEDGQPKELNLYLDTNDSIKVADEPISTYIIKKEIKSENLFNWETEIKKSELPAEYQSGKHLFRLISESIDTAGNIERTVQGWFTYWNESDIPWISADFGGPTLGTIKSVYPRSVLQGQAHDDDGLKSFKLDVYLSDGTRISEKCQDVDLTLQNSPTYYAWSFDAVGQTCIFYIVVSCEDIYGTKSEVVTRYMQVEDVNPPTIMDLTPSKNSQIPITGNGDLTISGRISDNDGVSSLKVVRIKTGKEKSEINYFSSMYSEWNKVSEENKYAVDANENKIWWIDLGEETTDTETSYHFRSFSKTFNLYAQGENGFEINGENEKLSTQTLILMALDKTGVATVELVTYDGDIKAPVITAEKLEIGSGTPFVRDDNKEYDLKNNNIPTIEKLEQGQRLKLSGKWSDDSDKLKDILVSWKVNDSTGLSIGTPVRNGDDWYVEIVPPKNYTSGAISISLEDFGGNVGKTNASFFVNDGLPHLERITSTKSDKDYKAGEVIDIVMEFNKNIKFTGDPVLKLNNGKSVSYSSGNGTSKHVYNYVISPNDEDLIPDTYKNANGKKILHVIGYDLKGCDLLDVDTGSSKVKMSEDFTADKDDPKSFMGGRSIVIDTKAPKIKTGGITLMTTPGTYKAGKEILFKVEFDEDIKIDDSKINLPTLSLNAHTGCVTSAVDNSKSGSRSLIFKYETADGDNASPLKVEGFNLNNCGITDNAGNPMGAQTETLTTAINILTSNPAKLSIVPMENTFEGNGEIIYKQTGIKFAISSSTGTNVKYSIDGGSNWNDAGVSNSVVSYSNGVYSITANGTYKIVAKQIDAAGNDSGFDPSSIKEVTIDAAEMLTYISVDKADGTYTNGTEIKIVLTFRKPVKFDSSNLWLKLNTTPERKATYSSYNSQKNEIAFVYSIQDGDASNRLGIESINGDIFDSTDNKIVVNLTGKNINEIHDIKVVTGNPVIKAAALSSDGKKLEIEFSAAITRSSGNITIYQASGYKAPAVLSTELFSKYNKLKPALADYYTLGTNGVINGSPDLTEKYILNYDKITTDTTLIDLLTEANADKSIISINSKYVSVDKENECKLVIDLSDDSYKLPVKGASYHFSIPAGFVRDKLNHENEAVDSKAISGASTVPTGVNGKTWPMTISGCEKPVIRVDKKNETIKTTGETVTVTQNYKVGVRIDCQTPDVTPTHTVKYQVNKIYDTWGSNSKKNKTTQAAVNPTISYTDQTDASIPGDFVIGGEKTTGTDTFTNYDGLIYKIDAKVGSETVSEMAYRTVYCLNSPQEDEVGDTYTQIWLRGGDWTDGGLSLSSFPISWNTSEYQKVRALTKETGSKWYWATWNINKAAYVMPLRGDLPKNCEVYDPDDSSKASPCGPSLWCWGMQGPTPLGQDYYTLFPGQAMIIRGDQNYIYGQMSFYRKHSEYYDTTTKAVIKSFKEGSASGGNNSGGSSSGKTQAELAEAFAGAGTKVSDITTTQWWQNTKLEVGSFDYKEGTIIKIVLASSTQIKFMIGNNDNASICYSENVTEYYVELTDDDAIDAFKTNNVYYATNLSRKSLKVYAYNP